ncbi:MAG: hypothetical protein AUK27_03995 [Deltaproteobacteria bacterium CG2_30_66_27]|nr:MAG: hypothetical protein AUK27_03995 [Deltaproteobacteria bacterium CG2_30_66_27]
MAASVFLLSVLSAVPPGLAAGPLLIDDFAAGLSPKWEKKVFTGETVYGPVVDEGRPALKAESRSSASAMIRRISLDPKTYPRLSWSWKIVRTIGKGDERTKAGDDYAARVYVVFPSALFWRTRAVNYIWANRLPRGAFLPNAYTGNAVMVAVESGDGNAGKWVDEERNLVEDYRRAFGEDPSDIGAVAIMTDTDNTGEQAVAWYGAIRFLPPGP